MSDCLWTSLTTQLKHLEVVKFSVFTIPRLCEANWLNRHTPKQFSSVFLNQYCQSFNILKSIFSFLKKPDGSVQNVDSLPLRENCSMAGFKSHKIHHCLSILKADDNVDIKWVIVTSQMPNITSSCILKRCHHKIIIDKYFLQKSQIFRDFNWQILSSKVANLEG